MSDSDTDPEAFSRTTFGKRKLPLTARVSLAAARLSYLKSELVAVLERDFDGDFDGVLDLEVSGGGPILQVGRSAFVVINNETGQFVFSERVALGDVVVTVSEERLIDLVVSHLLAGPRVSMTRAERGARMLVGETLADAERLLIVCTLRHCDGNRVKAADMLGISLSGLRGKLRSYWPLK